MKLTTADYPATCAVCSAPVEAGEKIGFDEKLGSSHSKCVDARITELTQYLSKKGVQTWSPDEEVGYTFSSEITPGRELMTNRRNPIGPVFQMDPEGSKRVCDSFFTTQDAEKIYRAFLPPYACEFTTPTDQWNEARD
jgi:hypothetical protein